MGWVNAHGGGGGCSFFVRGVLEPYINDEMMCINFLWEEHGREIGFDLELSWD